MKLTKRSTQIFIIVFSCVLAYSKVYQNEYVFDDSFAIQTNALVQSGIEGIGKIFQTTLWAGAPRKEAIYAYRPVTIASFAIDYELFGADPAASHVVQLCLYVVLCIFTYLTLEKLLESKYPLLTFFISMLFALHPIHTEIVSNLKSRDELLCLLFAIVSLYCLLVHLSNAKPHFYILALFFYMLSLLSKETSVCFLGIMPLTMYYFYRYSWKQIGKYSLGFVVVFLIFLAMRYWVLSNETKPFFVPGYLNNPMFLINNFWYSIGTKFYILGKYLQLLVLPYNLTCCYFYNDIPIIPVWDWRSIVSLLAYVGLLYYVYRNFKKQDIVAYGILCYLGGLFLFSHLVIPFAEAMGERLIFTASWGYCIALGGVFYRLSNFTNQKIYKFANIGFLSFVLVLCLYGLKTYSRHQEWKNGLILYETDAKYSPNSFLINKTLASWYYSEVLKHPGDKQLLQKALYHHQKTNEVMPENIVAWEKHGFLHLLNGDERSAHYYFQRAVDLFKKIQPSLRGMTGEFDNELAIKRWEELYTSPVSVIYFFPSLSDLYKQIGMSYYKTGRYKQAADYLKEAEKEISSQEGKTMVWLYLSAALLQLNQTQEALKYISLFCGVQPNSYDCINNTGVAYFQLGDYQKSSEFFEKALQMAPSEQVLNNLISSYAQLGNVEKANYYRNVALSFKK